MKKEKYFTSESIGEKARDMLRDVSEIRKRHSPAVSPADSALLVLDMQRYFLAEDSHAFIPAAAAILPGVARLIDSYSRRNLPIIFTRHLNTEADAGMMSVWWNDLIEPGTPLSWIVPELNGDRGEVIKKTQYDAFHGTDLERRLRDRGVRQVVICGVMTHLCCETTARAAFVRGFEVILAIDGTATYNEPLHRATLWHAAHGFAVPLLVEEIADRLSSAVGDGGMAD